MWVGGGLGFKGLGLKALRVKVVKFEDFGVQGAEHGNEGTDNILNTDV